MKKVSITVVTMLLFALGISTIKAQECSAIFDENDFRHKKAVLRAVTPTLQESYDAVTIDVLVVYTPAAKEWAIRNNKDIDDLIDQTMVQSNAVLNNSKTFLTLRLAHKQGITYTETNDPNTDLARLRSPEDGYADEAHALRTRYHADIVVMLLGEAATNGVLGAGYIPSSEWGNPKAAFSVVRAKTLANDLSFIHEIGHNLGCGHHTDLGDRTGLYSYSHGFKATSSLSNRFSSIMSYENTNGVRYPRIPYFSDENLSFEGTSIGSSTANNAKTIRQMKSIIAAYSDEIPFTDAFLQNITLSEGALSPAFNAGTYDYTVSVDNHTEYIDVEGIKNSPYASVSGNALAMPLHVGDNVVTIKVEDSWTNYEKTYTLTIRRASVSTGMNETDSDMIKVFPNPVVDELSIESGNLKINQAEICTISGQSAGIYDVENNPTIDVASLAQGIYLLKITTANQESIVKKFIKK